MKKYYANDVKVASKLVSCKGVSKASDFITGSGKHIKKLNVNTDFSEQAWADLVLKYPHKYKKYVVDYVKKNPRARLIVYTTNMRLAKKVSGDK